MKLGEKIVKDPLTTLQDLKWERCFLKRPKLEYVPLANTSTAVRLLRHVPTRYNVRIDR